MAAVTARLLGLDARQAAQALALALTRASPGVGHHGAATTARWLASVEELRQMINTTNVPDFEAVARTGVGVFDTLKAVAKLVLTELKKGGGG